MKRMENAMIGAGFVAMGYIYLGLVSIPAALWQGWFTPREWLAIAIFYSPLVAGAGFGFFFWRPR